MMNERFDLQDYISKGVEDLMADVLKATLKNGNLKVSKHRKVAYESDNPAVATVSNSGKIKAVGTGTCHIYAYAQNGVSAKCTVKVSAKK